MGEKWRSQIDYDQGNRLHVVRVQIPTYGITVSGHFKKEPADYDAIVAVLLDTAYALEEITHD